MCDVSYVLASKQNRIARHSLTVERLPCTLCLCSCACWHQALYNDENAVWRTKQQQQQQHKSVANASSPKGSKVGFGFDAIAEDSALDQQQGSRTSATSEGFGFGDATPPGPPGIGDAHAQQAPGYVLASAGGPEGMRQLSAARPTDNLPQVPQARSNDRLPDVPPAVSRSSKPGPGVDEAPPRPKRFTSTSLPSAIGNNFDAGDESFDEFDDDDDDDDYAFGMLGTANLASLLPSTEPPRPPATEPPRPLSLHNGVGLSPARVLSSTETDAVETDFTGATGVGRKPSVYARPLAVLTRVNRADVSTKPSRLPRERARTFVLTCNHVVQSRGATTLGTPGLARSRPPPFNRQSQSRRAPAVAGAKSGKLKPKWAGF